MLSRADHQTSRWLAVGPLGRMSSLQDPKGINMPHKTPKGHLGQEKLLHSDKQVCVIPDRLFWIIVPTYLNELS